MIVQISTSGGFGGLGLGNEARIEVDKLPEEIRERTCEMLTDGDLSKLAKLGEETMPDGVRYVLTLEDMDGKHVYEINETAMAPEMLDLIDELMVPDE